MDPRSWSSKDFVFALLLFILVVEAGLFLGQNDRQLLRINAIIDELKAIKDKPAAVVAGGSGAGATVPVQLDPAVTVDKGPRDMIIYHIGEDPATLNPEVENGDSITSNVNGMILDSLIDRDYETLKWKGKLAKSWEASDDHLTYTFHLREDVKWSDGKPFTAEDCLFTYKVVRHPKIDNASMKSYLSDLQDCKVLSPYTVQFTWSKPYFMSLNMCGGMAIYPKHYYEAKVGCFVDEEKFGEAFNQLNEPPIGTGPWKFKEWVTKEHILLERNETYWDHASGPWVKFFKYKVIPDNNTAMQSVKNGDIDYFAVRPEDWVNENENPIIVQNFHKFMWTRIASGYAYIGLNLRKPYFADKRCRQAITHLVDKPRILEDVFYKLNIPTTGPFSTEVPSYNKDVKDFEFSLEKAARLLDEAGWKDTNNDGIRDKDGVEFDIEYKVTNSNPDAERIARIFKEAAGKIGVNVRLVSQEWSLYTQDIRGRKFDMYQMGWSFGGVDQDPNQIWHSKYAEDGSNYVGFKNAKVDEIIEKARTEFDEDKRNAMYREMHAVVHDECPYVFLYYGRSRAFVSKRFENVKPYSLGFKTREWYVKPENVKYK